MTARNKKWTRGKRAAALATGLFAAGSMLLTPALASAQLGGGIGGGIGGVGTGLGTELGRFGAGVGGVGTGLGTGLGTGFGRGIGGGLGASIAPERTVAPVAVDDILDAPAAFLGRLVRVRGQVSDVVGRNVFVLNDIDRAFDREILVTSPTDFSAMQGLPRGIALRPGMVVSVTGYVQQFNPQALAATFGTGLGAGVFNRSLTPFAGQPAILAWTVQTPQGVLSPSVAPVALDDILDAPAAFLGRLVRVQGQVTDNIGRNLFVLNDIDRAFDREILVFSPSDFSAMPGLPRGVALRPGQTVTVVGWVQAFNPQALGATFGTNFGALGGALGGFTNTPAIFAWLVTPSNVGAGVSAGAGVVPGLGGRFSGPVSPGIGRAGSGIGAATGRAPRAALSQPGVGAAGTTAGVGAGLGGGLGVDRGLGVNRGLGAGIGAGDIGGLANQVPLAPGIR